jgi:hypothetical protein
MRKLRQRDQARCHPTSKWQSLDINPGSWSPQATTLLSATSRPQEEYNEETLVTVTCKKSMLNKCHTVESHSSLKMFLLNFLKP